MKDIKVIKRDGTIEDFNFSKIENAIIKAFKSVEECSDKAAQAVINVVKDELTNYYFSGEEQKTIHIESLQNLIEEVLWDSGYFKVSKSFMLYRNKRKELRDFVNKKLEYINNYAKSDNTANATIDDNSNVSSKNIGVLNAEIHKEDNINISRKMVVEKLKKLYPDFNAKNYIKDLEHHVIYKHDESSFSGAIAPYCVSATMYPFLLNGLKDIGGLSASPKNLDSFCGIYINMVFTISAQFAGALATSEFLLYFDYFARKEWGDDYHLKLDKVISSDICIRSKTILSQIHQHFQQVVYSINQPAAARGMQSAFVNFSFFDKPFFDGMFGEFYFPDGSQPKWESFNWLQKDFLHWFNQERLKTMLTFPVCSQTLIYKDGKFEDEETAQFTAKELSEGNSFFIYISDTVDSLSSCCRLKNMIQTKEFNFTNGNMGIQTGSKSVITINLNRLVQDSCDKDVSKFNIEDFRNDLVVLLDRIYKYHTAYNELLLDMYNANLLPVYKAGFINLNKQYLTIGINGLNECAEFLGIECNDNIKYKDLSTLIFKTISAQNKMRSTAKCNFNCEFVPAESLAIKNYNWDKNDGYWVPENRNLYASYMFIPSDPNISILEKIKLHGSEYIGDHLNGGSSAHLNLAEHLSEVQYKKLLEFAAKVGCQYFTFNIPNCECEDCGFIAKKPFDKCPKCGSTNVSLWDRVIGYLTKIKNWSEGRQIEQKTRVYENNKKL